MPSSSSIPYRPPPLGTFQKSGFLVSCTAGRDLLESGHEPSLEPVTPADIANQTLPIGMEIGLRITRPGPFDIGEGRIIVFALTGVQNPHGTGSIQPGGQLRAGTFELAGSGLTLGVARTLQLIIGGPAAGKRACQGLLSQAKARSGKKGRLSALPPWPSRAKPFFQ